MFRPFGISRNLCAWFEFRMGFGLGIYKIRRVMGYEPIVVIMLGTFWIYVAPKTRDYGF